MSFPDITVDPQGPLPGYTGSSLPTLDKESGSYASFGVRYEDETWLVMAEATQTRVDGYFSDSDSGYVTVGYHINQVMPYVSLARLKTVDNDERDASKYALGSDEWYQYMAADKGLTYERVAYSLGARWDIQPGLAMKFDTTYTTNFGDTAGGMAGNTTDEDSAMVYTIKLDATF